jgi:hypothetical protein
MQPLAFLWFEMQMTQQYLREKTFGPAPSPANSANLNTAIGASRGIGNAIIQEVLRRGARVLRAVRKPIVCWRCAAARARNGFERPGQLCLFQTAVSTSCGPSVSS